MITYAGGRGEGRRDASAVDVGRRPSEKSPRAASIKSRANGPEEPPMMLLGDVIYYAPLTRAKSRLYFINKQRNPGGSNSGPPRAPRA